MITSKNMPQTKFGYNRISGASGNMWNIRPFVTLFFPNGPGPGGHTPPPLSTQNGLDDVDSRTDVHFAVKIKTFSKPRSQVPKTDRIWHYCGGAENFRSILPLTFSVSEVNSTPFILHRPLSRIFFKNFGWLITAASYKCCSEYANWGREFQICGCFWPPAYRSRGTKHAQWTFWLLTWS